MKFPNNNITNIAVLGASFDTGNLGVTALASSTIFLIKLRWPQAQIYILGGRKFKIDQMEIGGVLTKINTYPVRYSSNLLIKNHIWKLLTSVIFKKITNYRLQKTKYQNEVKSCQCPVALKRTTSEALLNADLICDITGGDSFSDIYGLARLLRGYLLKRICQMTGKPFIMLPQTYGPYKTWAARRMARTILANTTVIYSRDSEGLKVVEDLIGPSRKVRLCPDVAFIMEPNRPKSTQINHLEELKANGHQLIGLNISGLLYNGGYTQENMFGLSCDYPTLAREVISIFTQNNHHVLLVPHVLPGSDFAVEDDLVAAKKAISDLPRETQKKIILLEKGYDQNETKYIIGLCDFFLGARMHATIAALSQGIPAIGMAYSKKFAGVFETAGVEDCVLDMRSLTNAEVLNGVMEIYQRRDSIGLVLAKTVPKLKEQLFKMFDGIGESAANE